MRFQYKIVLGNSLVQEHPLHVCHLRVPIVEQAREVDGAAQDVQVSH